MLATCGKSGNHFNCTLYIASKHENSLLLSYAQRITVRTKVKVSTKLKLEAEAYFVYKAYESLAILLVHQNQQQQKIHVLSVTVIIQI